MGVCSSMYVCMYVCLFFASLTVDIEGGRKVKEMMGVGDERGRWMLVIPSIFENKPRLNWFQVED